MQFSRSIHVHVDVSTPGKRQCPPTRVGRAAYLQALHRDQEGPLISNIKLIGLTPNGVKSDPTPVRHHCTSTALIMPTPTPPRVGTALNDIPCREYQLKHRLL